MHEHARHTTELHFVVQKWPANNVFITPQPVKDASLKSLIYKTQLQAMNSLWQNDVLSILNANNVNLYDLLLFILHGHLDIPFCHRIILQHKTSDILDLWLEPM